MSILFNRNISLLIGMRVPSFLLEAMYNVHASKGMADSPIVLPSSKQLAHLCPHITYTLKDSALTPACIHVSRGSREKDLHSETEKSQMLGLKVLVIW